MVESLMLTKKLVKDDLIILYSDIFFDKRIVNNIRKIKGNVIPVNKKLVKFVEKKIYFSKNDKKRC